MRNYRSISQLFKPRICSAPVNCGPAQLLTPFRAARPDHQGTSKKTGNEGCASLLLLDIPEGCPWPSSGMETQVQTPFLPILGHLLQTSCSSQPARAPAALKEPPETKAGRGIKHLSNPILLRSWYNIAVNHPQTANECISSSDNCTLWLFLLPLSLRAIQPSLSRLRYGSMLSHIHT